MAPSLLLLFLFLFFPLVSPSTSSSSQQDYQKYLTPSYHTDLLFPPRPTSISSISSTSSTSSSTSSCYQTDLPPPSSFYQTHHHLPPTKHTLQPLLRPPPPSPDFALTIWNTCNFSLTLIFPSASLVINSKRSIPAVRNADHPPSFCVIIGNETSQWNKLRKNFAVVKDGEVHPFGAMSERSMDVKKDSKAKKKKKKKIFSFRRFRSKDPTGNAPVVMDDEAQDDEAEEGSKAEKKQDPRTFSFHVLNGMDPEIFPGGAFDWFFFPKNIYYIYRIKGEEDKDNFNNAITW